MGKATEELRAKRSKVLDRREAIISAALKANRGLTAAEKASDNALAAEARTLTDTISRGEEVERARFSGFAGAHRVEVRGPSRPHGWTFTACLLSIAGAEHANKRGTGPVTPAQFAEERLHDFEAASALSSSTVAGGGGLIHEDVSEDFIEALYSRTVVRAAGARIEPMPSGNLDLSGVSSGPITSWIGEQAVSKGTASTFKQRKLLAKELRVLCPMAGSTVRHIGERGVANVREDILRAMAAAEDAAFLRGPGTSGTPMGLLQFAGGTSACAGSPTFATITGETGTALQALLNANCRMISPAWIWAPRTTQALDTERSTTGVKIWPEMERGLFRRYPFFDTTSIPTNLGGGGIDSEIYFADFADVVIGQGQTVVRMGTQGMYTDSAGNTQSAYSRDEVLLDVIEYVDLNVRHPESVYVLTAVEYLGTLN